MVRIKSPSQSRLEEAEEEFKDLLHDSNWIGSPERSVEVIVNGRKSPLYSNSVLSLEPYLSDSCLIASFRGVSDEEYSELRAENTGKMRRVGDKFLGTNFYFEGDKLAEAYRKLGIEPFSNYVFDVEFEGVVEDFSNALLFEKAVADENSLQVNQGSLSARSSGGTISDTFDSVQDNLSVEVRLEYLAGTDPVHCSGTFNSGEAQFKAQDSSPNEEKEAERIMRDIYQDQRDNGSLDDLRIEK